MTDEVTVSQVVDTWEGDDQMDELFPALPEISNTDPGTFIDFTATAVAKKASAKRAAAAKKSKGGSLHFSKRIFLTEEEATYVHDMDARKRISIFRMVSRRTGVEAELHDSRDGTLIIFLSGKESSVLEANTLVRRAVFEQIQTELEIDERYHSALIGKGGSVIRALEADSSARIRIRKGEPVLVTGPRLSVSQACNAIAEIVAKEARFTVEEISIRRDYHVFVKGPGGATRSDMEKETGARISIPRREDKSDLILVRGDIDDVTKATAMIQELYVKLLDDMMPLRAKVPKHQHKFVEGPRGRVRQAIERETSTNISIPDPDEEGEHISILGEQSAVTVAFRAVMDKARNGAEEILEIPAEQHPFLIGAKGARVKSIQTETGAFVEFPGNNSGSDQVLVTGDSEAVTAAVELINTASEEFANRPKTLELVIASAHHSYLIGPGGSRIRSLQEKYAVHVRIPNKDTNSPTVIVRGSADDLEPAAAQLKAWAAEAAELGPHVTLTVIAPTDSHSYIIGPSGSRIREIQESTGATLTMPKRESGEEKVSVSGREKQVTAAIAKVKDLLLEHKDVDVYRPVGCSYPAHKFIAGPRGTRREKFAEDHGVRILFPRRGKVADTVTLVGHRDKMEAAEVALAALVAEFEAMPPQITKQVTIPSKFIGYLVGPGGERVNSIMKDTGAKIDIRKKKNKKKAAPTTEATEVVSEAEKSEEATEEPTKEVEEEPASESEAETHTNEDEKKTVVRVTGSEEDVDAAVEMIVVLVKGRENAPLYERVDVPVELLPALKTKIVKAAKGTGVTLSAPFTGKSYKEQKTRYILNSKPDNKASLLKVKKAIVALVEKYKGTGVCAEVNVPSSIHAMLIGSKGSKVIELMKATETIVYFPKNGSSSKAVTVVGGAVGVVKVVAKYRALAAQASLPTQKVTVPKEIIPRIIGSEGKTLKAMEAEFGVTIDVPGRRRGSTTPVEITIRSTTADEEGISGCVEKIQSMIVIVQNTTSVSVEVPRAAISSIVGRGGITIKRLSTTYGAVRIDIGRGDKDPEAKDTKVTISGEKEACEKVRSEILEICEREERRSQMALVPVESMAVAKAVGGPGNKRFRELSRGGIVVYAPIARRKEKDGRPRIKIIGADPEALKRAVVAVKALIEAHGVVAEELISIPSSQHSHICGEKNASLFQMQDDFGCKVQFSKTNGGEATISGSEKDVAKMTSMLLELSASISAYDAKLAEVEAAGPTDSFDDLHFSSKKRKVKSH